MPRSSRHFDYIDVHAGLHRRVSNLETGVHPTASEIVYVESAETILPVDIVATNPKWTAYTSAGSFPAMPKWQRHAGVVTLLGGLYFAEISPTAPGTRYTWADVADEEKWGELPPEARPRHDLYVNVALLAYPGNAVLHVQENGDLSIINPHPADLSAPCRLEGASWTHD